MSRDRVTPELHAAVMERDRRCILFDLDSDHVWRDRWGQPHMPGAVHLLTLEHVHEGYGLMGKRAPNTMRTMVAVCWAGNVGVPSKEQRAGLRAYLAEVNEGVEA